MILIHEQNKYMYIAAIRNYFGAVPNSIDWFYQCYLAVLRLIHNCEHCQR